MTDASDKPPSSQPKRELSLFDSTSIVVGIIIGAGIYQTAPDVAKAMPYWWGVPCIWIVGGLLSLCGALCYAELATAYPREGGDYVYFNRAYGPWAGFLFGWVQLTIVRPGDIAVMAFAFATYARTLWDPFAGTSWAESSLTSTLYAAAAVVVLTGVNILGVREGKWTQNILTSVKALGLLSIVGVALAAPEASSAVEATSVLGTRPLSLALILVLFTFGGWNEMAYVAAEVKDPRRNIVRALVLGTTAVTGLYLLVNGAFLWTLGHEGMAASEAVATDTVSAVFPVSGARLIAVLVCVSALGAVNGLVLTGSRISYAVGADHRAFRLLGRWHLKTGTPVWALLVQGAIAVTLIVRLGSFMNAVLYTAAAVYSFYLATCIAVVVLRIREPDVERPYRVTAYPLPVLIFGASCVFLIYSAVNYMWSFMKYGPLVAAALCGIMLVGVLVYLLGRRRMQ
ncbi:MAG: amino acid permease [Planctomycetaceae bacterium]|nr:amino acid permease [Planctomycetaceae bacterium]